MLPHLRSMRFSTLKSVSVNPKQSFYNCNYWQKCYFSKIKTFNQWFEMEHKSLQNEITFESSSDFVLFVDASAKKIGYGTFLMTELLQRFQFKTIFKNSIEKHLMYNFAFETFYNVFRAFYAMLQFNFHIKT